MPPNRFLIGAIAGFSATAAMTLAILPLYRRLPPGERYPLLPREITTTIARQVGADGQLDEARQVNATLISHFGYGAAVGALYPDFARLRTAPAMLEGPVYGLLVWGASYLGWLPAFGILRPATQHPRRRTLVMLLAHVVWGAATSAVTRGLERAANSPLTAGCMRDAP